MKTPITKISPATAKAYVDGHVESLVTPGKAIGLRLPRGADRSIQFPRSPGVYSVFEDGKLIYVGETGNLWRRMRDLLDTRNHTLRRRLGRAQFAKHHSYRDASARAKFPAEIERRLTRFMLKHLTVKAVPVSFGRKEIEEAVIERKRPKYNVKGPR